MQLEDDQLLATHFSSAIHTVCDTVESTFQRNFDVQK